MLLRLLLALCLTSLLVSCRGDECALENDSECRNGRVATCVFGDNMFGGRRYWRTSACESGLCREADGRAFCVLEPEPAPVCAQAAASGPQTGNVCVGATFTVCTEGWITHRQDCLACEATEPGLVECHGGPRASCEQTEQCLSPLVCEDERCRTPCQCPNDGGCAECGTEPDPECRGPRCDLFECWATGMNENERECAVCVKYDNSSECMSCEFFEQGGYYNCPWDPDN